MARKRSFPEGVEFTAPIPEEYADVLSPDAVSFVAGLAREFTGRVDEILAARQERQLRINAGEMPDFPSETREVRESEWRVAPAPPDLQDRRVEITGPPDRKMLINALNSGASTYMTDLEDANCPTWRNMLESQYNIRDAVRGTITYDDPNTGKHYELGEELATLIVRPRGWHLFEKHMLVDGRQVPGALFDFGLAFFHNAGRLIENGSGPYYYLPKLEGYREARLWNDVFNMAQDELGIPRGTIRATVLVETILATFEMDEILYELRDHSSGLNAGRWDYIFSYIKKFREHEDRLLPDRAQVTMTVPFMRAYTQLLVKVCHRRGAHAIGGMAAQIPVKDDPKKNEEAFAKVRADKEREARDGHDGTWVAHPALVPVAKEVFDEYMPQPNQIETKKREDVHVTAEDLLERPEGTITMDGFRNNISVGIQYLGAWFSGRGAVPVFNLMEDTATAEISRAQVWQWIHHPKAVLDDGTKVTKELFHRVMAEEVERIREEIVGPERFRRDRFDTAIEFFDRISTQDEFVEFLTLPGYDYLE
ncbi:Malate synthase A [Rubrobacter xylanophilus DSM 9941]|uniref:Malate synthase n=1 Tax=Rubrobacter xylanophilus (strain DSM 9941 / JCM 11954 / NBRC 16129 / PRD-1) TaxID=266117 RepID=Q1AUB9_RUBXD|nr:malate synthase A [Rubrobacter xylanophilus]ABG05009.1 Malate synthase A [Rubrobacter xylanophilus DSM 9941]